MRVLIDSPGWLCDDAGIVVDQLRVISSKQISCHNNVLNLKISAIFVNLHVYLDILCQPANVPSRFTLNILCARSKKESNSRFVDVLNGRWERSTAVSYSPTFLSLTNMTSPDTLFATSRLTLGLSKSARSSHWLSQQSSSISPDATLDRRKRKRDQESHHGGEGIVAAMQFTQCRYNLDSWKHSTTAAVNHHSTASSLPVFTDLNCWRWSIFMDYSRTRHSWP